MIFSTRKQTSEASFVHFKNENIENVFEYPYLGMLINSNGSLKQSTAELTKKGKKVLFTIKSYTKSLNNLPINVANNLFDTLVKPIITYNSEIAYLDSYNTYFKAKKRALNSGKDVDPFNFIDKTTIENLHLGYCKYALGINKSSSNFGTRNEIGRYPIECHIKTQTIMYLARLFTDNLNPLLIESFNLTKSLDACNIYVYTWFTYAKDILMET